MTQDFSEPFRATASKSVTADIYSGVKHWFKTLDPTGSKLNEYHDGIKNVFGVFQIMGMPSPRKLEHVYVGLRATDDLKKFYRKRPCINILELNRITLAKSFTTYRDDQEIDLFLNESGYDTDIEINLLSHRVPTDVIAECKDDNGHAEHAEAGAAIRASDAITYVNAKSKLFILGQPGSGKTTFLKYLALVYSKHLDSKVELAPLLPLFVPLREFKRVGQVSPNSEWLRNFVLSSAAEISSKPFTKEWLENMLENGHCLVLLDGIDELPLDQLQGIYQSIRAFSSKYFKNKIIVTCRVASFDGGIEGFDICEIDDFNDDDKNLFVRQWFGDDGGEAARVISDIKLSGLADDLCRTPLLITMICILYRYKRRIPNNRAELYESCIDALLFRWDVYRSVDRSKFLPSEFSPERKKLLLSRIAHKTFRKDIIYVPYEQLREMIRQELELVNNIRETIPDDFIKEMEHNNGLLVEYSTGIYCFSHLTFQEFFVALYYCDTKTESELFNYAMADPKYLEIFLMYAEKSYNCDKIVMNVLNCIQNRCFNEGCYDEYSHTIITEILRCDLGMHNKLYLALRECKLRLEQLEISNLEAGHSREEDDLDGNDGFET